MKFVFFQFRRTETGLGDEGPDGAMPPPRIFGLEPPLINCTTFADFKTFAIYPDRQFIIHCVSKKNDTKKNVTDVTHSFNPHQPILVIFGRDVAEGVCY